MSKTLLATPAHVVSACGIGSVRGLRARVHVCECECVMLSMHVGANMYDTFKTVD